MIIFIFLIKFVFRITTFVQITALVSVTLLNAATMILNGMEPHKLSFFVIYKLAMETFCFSVFRFP